MRFAVSGRRGGKLNLLPNPGDASARARLTIETSPLHSNDPSANPQNSKNSKNSKMIIVAEAEPMDGPSLAAKMIIVAEAEPTD
jgi:hypothetical protein